MSESSITPPRAPVVELSAQDRQALEDLANGSGTMNTSQLTTALRIAARYLLSVIDDVVFTAKVRGK